MSLKIMMLHCSTISCKLVAGEDPLMIRRHRKLDPKSLCTYYLGEDTCWFSAQFDGFVPQVNAICSNESDRTGKSVEASILEAGRML